MELLPTTTTTTTATTTTTTTTTSTTTRQSYRRNLQYIFVSSECLMKTVVIYHEAVSKLVFMKISFIIKIIVNSQTFLYLLILSFIVKIIVHRRNYRRRQNTIVYRQNHRSSWKL